MFSSNLTNEHDNQRVNCDSHSSAAGSVAWDSIRSVELYAGGRRLNPIKLVLIWKANDDSEWLR